MAEDRRNQDSGLTALTRAAELVRSDMERRDKRIRELEERLSLSDLLKQVNNYMGTILDFDEMLGVIDDVLAGVMGGVRLRHSGGHRRVPIYQGNRHEAGIAWQIQHRLL